MEIGEEEVFKTAGFRVREAEARGLCRSDADRDDARRPIKRVADGLVPERHEGAWSDLQPVRRQPGGPRLFAELGLGHDGLQRRQVLLVIGSRSVRSMLAVIHASSERRARSLERFDRV